MIKIFKRSKVKDINDDITDEKIEEIEKKAKEEVEEMFASTVRHVDYIEVCYKNGETKRFGHDELDWYSRDESTLDIETKMEHVIVRINETRVITIKKYKICPKIDCNGNMIIQTGQQAEEFTEDEYYTCDKCGNNLSSRELL